MSVEVLKSRDEVTAARKRLREMGADVADPAFVARVKASSFWPGIPLGDQIKSWDIWKTVSFIRENLPGNAAVLDLGAYCCEVLPALHRLGYRSLTGVDLNPRLSAMPHQDEIRYLVGNFLETTLPDGSFDAITAISVIEHGYRPETLFREISRLLKPGGYFIASIDYWPEKIDTAGVTVFGLDWLVFSRQDVTEMFTTAGRYGLEAVGPVSGDAGEPFIAWQGRNYTFAWVAMRKS